METKRIRLIETSEHSKYTEFEQKQLICTLEKGETLILKIMSKEGTEIEESKQLPAYTAKFINCHFNLVFQDKGKKKPEIIKKE